MTQDTPKRFTDEGEGLGRFAGRFLVRCPRCQQKALVRPVEYHREGSPWFVSHAVLTCGTCGYSKDRRIFGGLIVEAQRPFASDLEQPIVIVGGAWDWYFHEPLWLQRPCCGETLWAYNEEHLDFIERFVAANLRGRRPDQNTSLASRLPRWIKLAKNRDELLSCIAKLRAIL